MNHTMLRQIIIFVPQKVPVAFQYFIELKKLRSAVTINIANLLVIISLKA